jgi:hypothetical protein
MKNGQEVLEVQAEPKPAQASDVPAVPITSLREVLLPRSFDQAVKLAELIASSDLAPKDYKGKPGNVLIAMQLGAEVGLQPMQAIQNIAVLNGRPSVWGDAMLGIVRASGLLAEFREWETEADGGTSHCFSRRKGEKEGKETTFSVNDAKRARLLDKEGPWQCYPKRMRQMRARGFNLRDQFADVLRGLQLAEEVIDITPTESVDVPLRDPNAETLAAAKATKETGASSPDGPADSSTKADSAPAQEPPGEQGLDLYADYLDRIKEAKRIADKTAVFNKAMNEAALTKPQRDGLRHALKAELEKLGKK